VHIPQQRRVLTEIPGPRSRELLARRAAAVPKGVFNVMPVFADSAGGAVVCDVDGNAFIDFCSGISVLNVGNGNPGVAEAVKRQADRYTHTCFHVTMNEPYLELAERLNELTPGGHPKMTMLANSGAEAVENAVKVARYFTGRQAVVTFDHGFHGRTLLAMTLTGKVMPYKQGFGPYAPEVYRLPFAYPYRCPAGAGRDDCGTACADYAIDAMERHIGPRNIACVVVEPVQGEGGFVVPAPEFLPRLAAFCQAHGILLVADEVQTAFGRTGRWFASEHWDLVPDIVTTAKSLGGGLPVGGVTGRADVMDAVDPGGLGGTFGGNPLSCAAAAVVLDVVGDEEFLAQARSLGDTIRARLDDIAERHTEIGEVRGLGPMLAFEFEERSPERAKAVTAAALERGLVLLSCGLDGNVIRLLPPLTLSPDELDEGLAILEESLAA
jgi:4-aminobutyrate aminotransferase / (S)-3-amino-2-methylpropionate transaminase / 5-aminovalerate transaminase